MAELPKRVEAQVAEFQQVQGQLQLTLFQKQQASAQIEEMNRALEELKKAGGKVFKSTGSVLVEYDKKALEKELEKRKETLSVRLKFFGNQEEKLTKRMLELKNEIDEATKGLKGSTT